MFDKYLKGDKIMWAVIFLLAIISVPAVYSAAGALAFKGRGGDTGYFLMRQITFIITGLFLAYIFHKLPVKMYLGFSKIFLPLAILLLLLTLFWGDSQNEAKRWLPIAFGFKLQTSDIGKFALIMFVARTLAINNEDEIKFKKAVKTVTIVTLIVIGLIVPFNLSTALLLFATVVAIMFVARVKAKQILNLGGLSAAGGVLYILLAVSGVLPGRAETWKNRIKSFFEQSEPGKITNDNYQADIAKIAIVAGGLEGEGPGNSTLKYKFPQAHSDFIYAFIIGEYGLISGLTILLLYVIFFYRGILIAKRATRSFPVFLSLGLTLSIVLQAFVNMSVSVGILPVTGQTLPLISMGGTSILVTSMALGIILSISRESTFNAQK